MQCIWYLISFTHGEGEDIPPLGIVLLDVEDGLLEDGKLVDALFVQGSEQLLNGVRLEPIRLPVLIVPRPPPPPGVSRRAMLHLLLGVFVVRVHHFLFALVVGPLLVALVVAVRVNPLQTLDIIRRYKASHQPLTPLINQWSDHQIINRRKY